MILPTIHMNGTSAETLSQSYETAMRALMQAVECLQDAAPNGRDYYPIGPDAVLLASREHAARLASLNGVLADLQALYEHAQEAVNARAEKAGRSR